jgi:hypothetical protein
MAPRKKVTRKYRRPGDYKPVRLGRPPKVRRGRPPGSGHKSTDTTRLAKLEECVADLERRFVMVERLTTAMPQALGAVIKETIEPVSERVNQLAGDSGATD